MTDVEKDFLLVYFIMLIIIGYLSARLYTVKIRLLEVIAKRNFSERVREMYNKYTQTTNGNKEIMKQELEVISDELKNELEKNMKFNNVMFKFKKHMSDKK